MIQGSVLVSLSQNPLQCIKEIPFEWQTFLTVTPNTCCFFCYRSCSYRLLNLRVLLLSPSAICNAGFTLPIRSTRQSPIARSGSGRQVRSTLVCFSHDYSIIYRRVMPVSRHFRDCNKKFELMLTRRAKAYNSFCSQTVSLSPAIMSQFILRVCAAAEDRKNKQNPLFWKLSVFQSSMLIRLKSSSLVLVVIGSMPIVICNRFHENLATANNGKK